MSRNHYLTAIQQRALARSMRRKVRFGMSVTDAAGSGSVSRVYYYTLIKTLEDYEKAHPAENRVEVKANADARYEHARRLHAEGKTPEWIAKLADIELEDVQDAIDGKDSSGNLIAVSDPLLG